MWPGNAVAALWEGVGRALGVMAFVRSLARNIFPSRMRTRLSRVTYYLVMFRRFGTRPRRTCNVCGYQGRFWAHGFPPRYDSLCPGCGSLERHRLLHLCDRQSELFGESDSVLHFAPEPCLSAFIGKKVGSYRTADIAQGCADMRMDIERMPLADDSVDVVLVNHVLEHVDDRRALPEIFRVLTPGGRLVAMIPIIEAWEATYENPAIVAPEQRDLHFGQPDHVRYYGRDFRDRLSRAGFELREFVASPSDCIAYGLIYGDKVFIGRKPARRS